MCEDSALLHDTLPGNESRRGGLSGRLAHVPPGGEIKATFDHTEDGCSRARRSGKGRTVGTVTIKHGEEPPSTVRSERENSYTHISPMIDNAETGKRRVQTAAPGHPGKKRTPKKVKQQKKQKR